MVTTLDVKELRDKTGVSIMQCKKALEEADGDMGKAVVILRKKGSEASAKKADRNLASGVVQAYIHNTKNVGAMVVLSCETDFVAKNDEFVQLAYNIAMHIAATDPEFKDRESVDEKSLETAKAVFSKEVEGKPENLKEKILKGKLDSYFKDKILLESAYIKDQQHTIKDLIDGAVQKFGERVELTGFMRYSIHN